MIILGIDLGKVRTGVSVCDKNEILASPVCVINEEDRGKLIDKIIEIAKEKNAELFAVGLPLNMDGSSGESAQNARTFAAELSEKSKIPYEMQDERGTTVTAHGYMNQNNIRGKKRKAVIDSAAAVIILQDFLEKRKFSKEK